jgi:hypothetical protein
MHASIDPSVMVRLNSNSTLDQSEFYIECSDLQLYNSPSRSIRRCLSDASDDDHFQIVTSKKSKHLNNGSVGIIHSQQIHHDKVAEIENGKKC